MTLAGGPAAGSDVYIGPPRSESAADKAVTHIPGGHRRGEGGGGGVESGDLIGLWWRIAKVSEINSKVATVVAKSACQIGPYLSLSPLALKFDWVFA